MSKWQGAAAVCINNKHEILMVYQGKPEEIKKWSVPSGGLKQGETFADCCVREAYEETGYRIEIIDEIGVKHNEYAEVHYFSAKVVGGQMAIHDPDDLIDDIEWRDLHQIPSSEFQYQEDIEFLKNYIQNQVR